MLKSVLMQTILEKRLNGLISVLSRMDRKEQFTTATQKAHGDYDEEGVFLPGYLLWEDALGSRLYKKEEGEPLTTEQFRAEVEYGLMNDGATFLFQDRAMRGTIPNELCKDAAFMSNTIKGANAGGRRPGSRDRHYSFDDIMTSLTPPSITDYSGTKTQVTCAIAYFMYEPRMHIEHQAHKFSLKDEGRKRISDYIDRAYDPLKAEDGTLLMEPSIVTLHHSRHVQRNLSGITRITNISQKFGHLATVSFEYVTSTLSKKVSDLSEEHVLTVHQDKPVVGVVREYLPCNISHRPRAKNVNLISRSDLAFDVDAVVSEAYAEYAQ